MLTKDALEEFKLECELHRITPRTIKGYYNSTLLFLTWLERQHEIKELEAIRPSTSSSIFSGGNSQGQQN